MGWGGAVPGRVRASEFSFLTSQSQGSGHRTSGELNLRKAGIEKSELFPRAWGQVCVCVFSGTLNVWPQASLLSQPPKKLGPQLSVTELVHPGGTFPKSPCRLWFAGPGRPLVAQKGSCFNWVGMGLIRVTGVSDLSPSIFIFGVSLCMCARVRAWRP